MNMERILSTMMASQRYYHPGLLFICHTMRACSSDQCPCLPTTRYTLPTPSMLNMNHHRHFLTRDSTMLAQTGRCIQEGISMMFKVDHRLVRQSALDHSLICNIQGHPMGLLLLLLLILREALQIWGILEGVPWDLLGGIPRAKLEAIPWGHLEGIPWGHLKGMTWGHPKGVPWTKLEGVPWTKLEGIPRGHLEGIPRGHLEGIPWGLLAGVPWTKLEDAPWGHLEGPQMRAREVFREGHHRPAMSRDQRKQVEDLQITKATAPACLISHHPSAVLAAERILLAARARTQWTGRAGLLTRITRLSPHRLTPIPRPKGMRRTSPVTLASMMSNAAAPRVHIWRTRVLSRGGRKKDHL
jgi:hypothetical protein